MIDGIFVRMYNLTPEWKIPKPENFTQKLMEEIGTRVTELREKNYEISKNEKEISADLAYKISCLTEATKAIVNISKIHSYSTEIFTSRNLTVIAHLLDSQTYPDFNVPSFANLKTQALSLFLFESTRPGGPQKIIENATFIRNMIVTLRANTKESSVLYQQIIKILENLAQNEELTVHLVNYGLFTLLLESIFKKELLPRSNRTDALKFLSKIVRKLDADHPLNRIIMSIIPASLHYAIYTNLPALDAMDILDNGIDSSTRVWTTLMRQEVFLVLFDECQTLQNNWVSYKENYIDLSENKVLWTPALARLPSYPEFGDLIQIEGVFLKNFNFNSFAAINGKLDVFVDEIGVKAQAAYERFMQMMEVFEKTPKASFSETELMELDRISCEVVTLMTSLMLGVEQYLYNQNHSKSLHYTFEEYKPKKLVESQLDIETINEEILASITKWMACLGYKKVNPHIKCTVLQLVYLIADLERGLELLKSKNIIGLLGSLLRGIIKGESSLGGVEERIILNILLRVLIKDPQLVQNVVPECLESFRWILSKDKPAAREIIENIMGVVVSDLKIGRETLINLNKDGELIKISTLANQDPKGFSRTHFWRNIGETGGADIQSSNLLNTLYKSGSEYKVKFPVISDYALRPLPHSRPEIVEKTEHIQDFIKARVEEYSKSDYPDTNTN